MVTSEYATGTVATACIGCLLWFFAREDGIWSTIVETTFDAIRDVISLIPSLPVNPFGWM